MWHWYIHTIPPSCDSSMRAHFRYAWQRQTLHATLPQLPRAYSLGRNGDPESGSQGEVVEADSSDLTGNLHVGAVDAQHKAQQQQHHGQTDVDNRVLHLLGRQDHSAHNTQGHQPECCGGGKRRCLTYLLSLFHEQPLKLLEARLNPFSARGRNYSRACLCQRTARFWVGNIKYLALPTSKQSTQEMKLLLFLQSFTHLSFKWFHNQMEYFGWWPIKLEP